MAITKISDKGLVAQEEITKALMELTKGITAEEAAIMLAGINIKELMISKLTNAYSEFQSGAIALLESTFTTATLSEAPSDCLSIASPIATGCLPSCKYIFLSSQKHIPYSEIAIADLLKHPIPSNVSSMKKLLGSILYI